MLLMLVKVVLPQIATMRMVVVVTRRQDKYYVAQGTFSHWTTGSLLKDEEAHVVCGAIERPDQRKTVEVLTWCQ